MPTIRIQPIVIDTAGWIIGVRSLVGLLEKAIPTAELEEIEALRLRAEAGGWEAGESFTELRQTEIVFQAWLPRLTGYAVLVLLHALVERQLLAVCDQLQRTRQLKLGVRDIHGSPIDKALTYLTKVADLEITHDLGWGELQNLQALRNIVVHRLGKPGERPDDQKIQRLISYYPSMLSVQMRPDGFEGEIDVPEALCRHFVDQVAAFFSRLFLKAGLLDEGDWFPVCPLTKQ